MKSQKLFLTLFVITVILLFTSVGFNAWQYKLNMALSEKVKPEKTAQLKVEDNSTDTPVKVERKDIKIESIPALSKTQEPHSEKVKQLESDLESAEQEIEIAYDELSDELAKKQEYKDAQKQLSKLFTSTSDSNKSMRETATRRAADDYDPLFKKLDITEDDFQKLKDLIVKNTLATTFMASSEEGLTKEEKLKASQERFEKAMKIDDSITELLGQKNYEVYQNYKNSITERRELNNFLETLPPDNRLSEDQEDRLIQKMYEERMAFYLNNQPDPKMLDNREEMDKFFMEARKNTNNKYLEASRNIFSPAQVEKYEAYLENKVKQDELIRKMSSYIND